MTIVTDNVGNQMYIISCMSVPAIVTCSKEREPFYDVHERLDDVEVEQAVLIISFLIREMHQSHWETLYAYFGPLSIKGSDWGVTRFDS